MEARRRAILLCTASLASGPTALGAGTPADADSSRAASAKDHVPTDSSTIGLSVLGGVAFPACGGQSEACSAALGPAPSLRAFVLYQPSRSMGFGFVGQVARVHWQASYPLRVEGGGKGQTESELTAGFVGLVGRFKFLAERQVSPIVEVALGSGFQAQTGSNYGCNGGFLPAGQLGLGASARLSPSFSLLATGSATGGVSQGCSTSDGPPVTPFAAWGLGLHVGAAFDIGLATATPSKGILHADGDL